MTCPSAVLASSLTACLWAWLQPPWGAWLLCWPQSLYWAHSDLRSSVFCLCCKVGIAQTFFAHKHLQSHPPMELCAYDVCKLAGIRPEDEVWSQGSCCNLLCENHPLLQIDSHLPIPGCIHLGLTNVWGASPRFVHLPTKGWKVSAYLLVVEGLCVDGYPLALSFFP